MKKTIFLLLLLTSSIAFSNSKLLISDVSYELEIKFEIFKGWEEDYDLSNKYASKKTYRSPLAQAGPGEQLKANIKKAYEEEVANLKARGGKKMQKRLEKAKQKYDKSLQAIDNGNVLKIATKYWDTKENRALISDVDAISQGYENAADMKAQKQAKAAEIYAAAQATRASGEYKDYSAVPDNQVKVQQYGTGVAPGAAAYGGSNSVGNQQQSYSSPSNIGGVFGQKQQKSKTDTYGNIDIGGSYQEQYNRAVRRANQGSADDYAASVRQANGQGFTKNYQLEHKISTKRANGQPLTQQEIQYLEWKAKNKQ